MKLDKSNHAVFRLIYYLIACVKYRKKVIDDCIGSAIGDEISTFSMANGKVLESKKLYFEWS